MPAIDRRTLLAGVAATTALSATSPARAAAQASGVDPELSGKSILITGCSSGFGRLGAEHYARLGARVFATMRNLPRPEADELVALARDAKLDLHVLELDITSDEQVLAAVAEAERINGGGLDVLVNNAGIGISGPVEVQDMEATRLAFDTNVFGCHRMARAVLPGMRAKKSGQIFQISSQLGRVIVPYGGHYSATKFALEAMGEQLAYELVPHNIEVTIVEPGGYPTKVWVNRNAYTGALRDRAEERHTAGYEQVVARMGTEDGSGRTADPMDVPRAIAAAIAMPAGTRPLRLPVSGGTIPQLRINEVTAETQVQWLGGSGLGPLIRAAHNV
ncbi:SDR family oxidoreductase [Parerythrobacter aurantius]|uniref:SDR family oxidoreductase n=1 Tax=Parerythrobacter aurantius TaxID=3127706 RepID=UPI003245762A